MFVINLSNGIIFVLYVFIFSLYESTLYFLDKRSTIPFSMFSNFSNFSNFIIYFKYFI